MIFTPCVHAVGCVSGALPCLLVRNTRDENAVGIHQHFSHFEPRGIQQLVHLGLRSRPHDPRQAITVNQGSGNQFEFRVVRLIREQQVPVVRQRAVNATQ